MNKSLKHLHAAASAVRMSGVSAIAFGVLSGAIGCSLNAELAHETRRGQTEVTS
jgi:hypothetical protein